jgi:hypothetical protein
MRLDGQTCPVLHNEFGNDLFQGQVAMDEAQGKIGSAHRTHCGSARTSDSKTAHASASGWWVHGSGQDVRTAPNNGTQSVPSNVSGNPDRANLLAQLVERDKRVGFIPTDLAFSTSRAPAFVSRTSSS